MTFQAYLDTIKAKTGMDPDDFQKIAAERGLLVGDIKAGPIQKWLKDEYDLGPGHSMALVSVFRSHLLPQSTYEESIDKFFLGQKARWQLAWDELMADVMHWPDVALQPTDTYIGI